MPTSPKQALDHSRPRLTARAVLLERPGGELQIGLGPEAVCVRDRGRRWHALLARCLGRTPLPVLLAATGLTQAETSPVLAELARRGLVDLGAERTRGRPTARPRVSLLGAGPLGLAIAAGLQQLDLDAVYVVDQHTPDASTYPDTTARRASEALCERLRPGARAARSPGPLLVPARRPTGLGGLSVELSVVASATLEPDRALCDRLRQTDVAHLVVRPAPGGAIVGPLVVPGRTACLRCCDLTRRDADPHWPQLLRQLGTRTAPIPAAVLAWAAGLVAVQVAGHLAGHPVDTLDGTVELMDHDPRQHWRAWPPHPECGCRW